MSFSDLDFVIPSIHHDDNGDDDVIVTPGKFDVVFGRGGNLNKHRKQNLLYKNLLRDHFRTYLSLKSNQKQTYVKVHIISTIHNNGGRFLVRSNKEDETAWKIATEDIVIDKIMQSLRDMKKEVSMKVGATTDGSGMYHHTDLDHHNNIANTMLPPVKLHSSCSLDSGSLYRNNSMSYSNNNNRCIMDHNRFHRYDMNKQKTVLTKDIFDRLHRAEKELSKLSEEYTQLLYLNSQQATTALEESITADTTEKAAVSYCNNIEQNNIHGGWEPKEVQQEGGRGQEEEDESNMQLDFCETGNFIDNNEQHQESIFPTPPNRLGPLTRSKTWHGAGHTTPKRSP